MGDVTLILRDLQAGQSDAAARLFALVYDELRAVAAAKMARESSAHTLQPTALVHEAWLRLGGDAQATWRSRAHFFGAAAEAMRRILIDRARRQQTARRGARPEQVDLDVLDRENPGIDDQGLLMANEALEKFAALDPAKAELVKLRFFVGLTIEQAAQALEISDATANRWWSFARAWLHREIEDARNGSA
jgi:RNA polymerase sigma factor (TIGR02999 family)